MKEFRGIKRLIVGILVATALVGLPVYSWGAGTAERGAGRAQTPAVLSISTAEGQAGGEICADLSLVSGQGVEISALTTDVTCDPSVLTPAGISTAVPGKRAEGNKISEVVYRVTVFGGASPLLDSVVARICFKAAQGRCGSFEMAHAQGTPTASSPEAHLVAITGTSGRVEIVGCASGVPGDCDDDGAVSIAEVQRVTNMFLGSAPAGCGADCDGDGMVSIGELQKVLNAYLGLKSSCDDDGLMRDAKPLSTLPSDLTSAGVAP